MFEPLEQKRDLDLSRVGNFFSSGRPTGEEQAIENVVEKVLLHEIHLLAGTASTTIQTLECGDERLVVSKLEESFNQNIDTRVGKKIQGGPTIDGRRDGRKVVQVLTIRRMAVGRTEANGIDRLGTGGHLRSISKPKAHSGRIQAESDGLLPQLAVGRHLG